MRKVSITPETRRIEINGAVFDIQKGDDEIFIKAADFERKYARFADPEAAKSVKIAEIADAIKDIISYIDEALGKGATAEITKGRPLGINNAVYLVSQICAAAVEGYNGDMAEKYGGADDAL